MDAISQSRRITPPRRLIVIGLTLGLIALTGLAPGPALADSGPEPTTLIIGAPASATVGQRMTVQAILVDHTGHPIAKATIAFSMPMTFLTGSSKMLLAQVVTDQDGRARAEIENRSSGDQTVVADFQGDERYAASTASAPVSVTGDDQQYAEDIGVHIPLFNTPPSLTAGGNVTVIGAALWPSMTGWPIAAVLIVIWTLYFVVILGLFKVASAISALSSNVEPNRVRQP